MRSDFSLSNIITFGVEVAVVLNKTFGRGSDRQRDKVAASFGEAAASELGNCFLLETDHILFNFATRRWA